MKFKFMGMKMNTLYVILVLLVILGIAYLCLNFQKDKKEGFIPNSETSLGIVLGLVGNDFYELPSDQEIKDAVDRPYDKRFNNAIKYAVYALYKAVTGAILIGDKVASTKQVIDNEVKKGRSNIDGMSSEQAQSEVNQLSQECQDAIKIQQQLDIIIRYLSTANKNVCGEPFKKSVQYDIYIERLNSVKICKQKLKDKIDSQQSLNILRDVADTSLEVVNEVLKNLELLQAELLILADCNTATAEGAGCPAGKEGNTTMGVNEDTRASNKSLPSNYNNAYSASLTSTTQESNLPRGVPKYMIPPGQEDLYILKSEVVPPVCPACPEPLLKCSDTDNKKCPPCPPCGRCPEPSFECKKVPNYGTGNLGANYNNFNTGFGEIMGPNGSITGLPYPASSQNSMYGA